MAVRIFPLLLAVALAACSSGTDAPTVQPPPAAGGVPPTAVDWLKAHAIPITTTQAGNGFADLQPVKAIVGNARIVSLGEATHGTREFFEMKHRVFEFLVREMGFTVFAIESEWAEAVRLNRWVQTGEGDPHQLLSGLYFWTWRTQEVMDLIQWMRAYNADPANARKLSFVGVDAQFPTVAMDTTVAYLRQAAPDLARAAVENYACFRPYSNDNTGTTHLHYRDVDDTTRVKCTAKVRQVYADIEANRARLEAASSPADYAFALRSARLVVQSEVVRADWAPTARDQYMAENAAWWLEQLGPDAKMVLWAHNQHVGTLPGAMGQSLRTEFGPEMRVFGFSFYQGSFTAVNLEGGPFGTYSVGPANPDSYEHLFHSTGLDRFILDLRPAATTPGGGWLMGPLSVREFGCCVFPTNSSYGISNVSLPTLYDAIIHIDNSTASRVLPFVF